MCVSKEAFIQGADGGLKYVLHVAFLTPLSLLEYLHKRHASCDILCYICSKLSYCFVTWS